MLVNVDPNSNISSATDSILGVSHLHRDKKSSSLDANIKGYILEKYDNEKLGSSATEDSSIVTTSILSSFRKNNDYMQKVTVVSVRFQTLLSCNASHLPENKVTNESDVA